MKCQITLEDTDEHLLLVEPKVEPEVERRTRALLVKVIKKEETPIRLLCKFVGPVHLIFPLEQNEFKKGIEARVRIGDTEGRGRLKRSAGRRRPQVMCSPMVSIIQALLRQRAQRDRRGCCGRQRRGMM